jgi:hypothetical protein
MVLYVLVWRSARRQEGGESMYVKRIFFLVVLVSMFLMVGNYAGAADPMLKPYILAWSGVGTIESKLGEVKASVAKEGFHVVGEYSPYKGAHVLVVTSEALKKSAAKSAFGAYGAAVRISLTEVGGGLQIAYMNPLYMAEAYRMNEPLSAEAAGLEKALGKKAEFGSKEEALKAVEANLAAHKGGTVKVYRIDLPGKKESVFGVGLSEGDGADAKIMKVVDVGEIKHTAHLPYEIMVSDGSVYMLHGKFRIAIDFPDLSMGTFMKISGAPSAIEEKLKLVAGGK